MQKASLLLAILAVISLAACSSRNQAPKMEVPSPEKRLYILKHRLNLTDEQLAAVKPILEQEHEKKLELMEEMKEGDRSAMSEHRQKTEDLEWSIYKQLSEHLTTEQMDLYSKLLEEEKQKMMQEMQSGPGGGGGRGGGGRGGPRGGH